MVVSKDEATEILLHWLCALFLQQGKYSSITASIFFLVSVPSSQSPVNRSGLLLREILLEFLQVTKELFLSTVNTCYAIAEIAVKSMTQCNKVGLI